MAARLRPLREDEFDAWVEHGKADYARDMIENGGAPPEQARAKSESDWLTLLPERLETPDQFIFAVEDEETGERVGDVWFARRETPFEGAVAFVYSIEIAEQFRGRGFGRQAMLLLEDEARARGLVRMSLNVFGGNAAARSLYRSLGYAESAVSMAKQLEES
jgi:ribosomal protein S18 acetylase RimI-like enzyme